MPCPQTGLRGVRAGQGLSVVRHRPHGAGDCRRAGHRPGGRTPPGDGRALATAPAPLITLNTRTARWTLGVLVVIAILVAALVMALRDASHSPTPTPTGPAREHRDADTAAALAGPRQRADLAP